MDAGFDDDAVLRLRRVVVRLARRLNAPAAGEGLTPAQASVLGLVAGAGPLGPGRLAELEGLNPTMVSRSVSRLETLGLVRREPDPADLRSTSVHVTPAGQKVHRRIKAARAAALRACLAGLDPAAEGTVLAALPALEAMVGVKPAAPAADT